MSVGEVPSEGYCSSLKEVSGDIHGRKFYAFHRWKIDITAELAKLSDLELKFKCIKQEGERAVVACEGDLENAEEILKLLLQNWKKWRIL